VKLPSLIGITGRVNAGKDTLAAHLVQEYGYNHIAFSDPLYRLLEQLDPWIDTTEFYAKVSYKEWVELDTPKPQRFSRLLEIFGWDRLKRLSSEVRKYLQLLGTEGGRELHGYDCWIKIAEDKIDRYPGKYVITGLRFDNEFSFVKRNRGEIWLVKSVREVPADPNHASEAIIDYEPYADMIIRNDGSVPDFHQSIDSILTAFFTKD
jgi:hypothetical protein